MNTVYRGIRRTTWRSWIVVAFVITGWPQQGPALGASAVQSGQYRQGGLTDWLTGTSTGVYVEGSTLRLQEGVTSGSYESPPFQADFAAAVDDSGRLRVVVDQVASLTDASALAWHARLC